MVEKETSRDIAERLNRLAGGGVPAVWGSEEPEADASLGTSHKKKTVQ